MQSSERGWYLVWDKLLLQTKLPLSSLLQSPLVFLGLTLWGMISNLGRKRRWWGLGVQKMNSASCPQHITYCLEILPNRDRMQSEPTPQSWFAEIKHKWLLFAQRRATEEYLQGSPELLRGIKNLLKAVRIVHAGKGSSDFRHSLKPTVSYSKGIFYIQCWTFRLKRWGRGPWVHVCTCMSGYKSVYQFLHPWCVHFLWFASWIWPRHVWSGKSTDFKVQYCHLLCVWFSLSFGFQMHKKKTSACSSQNCEE